MLKKYSKLIFVFVLKLSICIAAFYFVFRKLDLTKLGCYLKDANLSLLICALISAHISLIFSALRSRYYFKEYGLLLEKKFSIALYYLGTFFNTLLPGGIGGDGYKVYLLWKLKHFSRITSLRIMLYERVSGFHVLALFGLLLVPFTNFIGKLPYLDILAFSCIVLITPCYLWGVKYVLKDQIKIAWKAAYFSFFVQLFQLFMIIFIIFSLVDEIDIKNIINFSFLFIAASVIAIIPISIGGAGLRELTFLYGMKLIDPALQEAGVAIALTTFIIYIITSLPGMFFMFKSNTLKNFSNIRR